MKMSALCFLAKDRPAHKFTYVSRNAKIIYPVTATSDSNPQVNVLIYPVTTTSDSNPLVNVRVCHIPSCPNHEVPVL